MNQLSPADCSVAVRSFARRLREQFSPQPGDRAPVDSLVREGSPSAQSLADELLDVLHRADHALHGSLAGLPAPDDSPGDSVVDSVGVVAARLATRIDNVPPKDWTVTALDELRTAVAEGGRLIRQIGQQLETARR